MAAGESSGTCPRQQAPRRRRLAPRSHVWVHFNCFTADDGSNRAECKRCHLVLGADTRNGTSSLWAHVRICKGPADGGSRSSDDPRPPPPLMPCPPSCPAAGPSSSSAREPDVMMDEHGSAIGDLARMITLRGYDSSIIEDDCFKSFVRRLNPELELPSRAAIDEMCDGVFDEARRDLFSRLSRVPGRVSVAVGRDEVEAMGTEVVYIACQFIDDEWNLHKVVMNAYVVGNFPYYHGPLLGVRETCLSDPLSYNWTIELAIEDISKRVDPDMLFMVAWEIDDDDDDHELGMQKEVFCNTTYAVRKDLVVRNTLMDNVLHSIARCLSSEDEGSFCDQVLSDVNALHLTRQRREQLLSELGLHNLRLYSKFWYSCYCSLEVHRHGATPGNADIDSEFREVMRKLLDAICRAIQTISVSRCPTSNLCLVELFNLRELLQSEQEGAPPYEANAYGDKSTSDKFYREYIEIKRDALREAKDTLDKALQASYLIWSIPLALNPRYKLARINSYFTTVFGSEVGADMISKVTTRIKDMFADYNQDGNAQISHRHSNNGNGETATVDGNTAPALLHNILDEEVDSQLFDEDMLQHLMGELAIVLQKSELDRYLEEDLVPETDDFDILRWWKDCTKYPTVARMARDALAMPTCTKLSFEQIFHVMSIIRGYSKEPFVDGYY